MGAVRVVGREVSYWCHIPIFLTYFDLPMWWSHSHFCILLWPCTCDQLSTTAPWLHGWKLIIPIICFSASGNVNLSLLKYQDFNASPQYEVGSLRCKESDAPYNDYLLHFPWPPFESTADRLCLFISPIGTNQAWSPTLRCLSWLLVPAARPAHLSTSFLFSAHRAIFRSALVTSTSINHAPL